VHPKYSCLTALYLQKQIPYTLCTPCTWNLWPKFFFTFVFLRCRASILHTLSPSPSSPTQQHPPSPTWNPFEFFFSIGNGLWNPFPFYLFFFKNGLWNPFSFFFFSETDCVIRFLSFFIFIFQKQIVKSVWFFLFFIFLETDYVIRFLLMVLCVMRHHFFQKCLTRKDGHKLKVELESYLHIFSPTIHQKHIEMLCYLTYDPSSSTLSLSLVKYFPS